MKNKNLLVGIGLAAAAVAVWYFTRRASSSSASNVYYQPQVPSIIAPDPRSSAGHEIVGTAVPRTTTTVPSIIAPTRGHQ